MADENPYTAAAERLLRQFPKQMPNRSSFEFQTRENLQALIHQISPKLSRLTVESMADAFSEAGNLNRKVLEEILINSLQKSSAVPRAFFSEYEQVQQDSVARSQELYVLEGNVARLLAGSSSMTSLPERS